MNRRKLIKQSSLALGGLIAAPAFAPLARELKNKTILVVSGWQYHNIGDIAHTPGLLNLLNTFLPETNVILWPNHEVRAIDEMLIHAFPDLKIINRPIPDEKIDSPELREVANKADFLLHGSGPSIVGKQKVNWWRKTTKKH